MERRWAEKLEWEQEDGEAEVKRRAPISKEKGGACMWALCWRPAEIVIEVGLVQSETGAKFDLCAEHCDEDLAVGLYKRMRRLTRPYRGR